MTRPVPPALRLIGLQVTFGAEAGRRSTGGRRAEAEAEPAGPVPSGLRGVSLEVRAGERLVLVGASGAGKTTLLRAVAGLVPIDEGSIEIGGRDVTRLPPERRGAVYLHQSPVLFPHLTVEENVAFPLRIRGVPRGEARKRVQEVLAAVRLSDLGHRPSGALSGGQRHRVALARAVVARPSLLLLDEPLSSLDPELRHEIRDVIVHLQAQAQVQVQAEAQGEDPADARGQNQAQIQPGLVLVTHDLEEAGLLGHRVGIVMEGGLAQLAPPEEIFRAPATLEVARFLGYRNELPCAPGSGMEARLFGGVPNEDPGEAEARNIPRNIARNVARDVARDFRAGNTAAGSPSVVVLPPGSVRVVPAARSSTPSEGEAGGARGRWVRLPGRLRHLAHPGPRPLARVEVDLPDTRPVLLEAEVEEAALADARADAPGPFEPGSPVVLLVDVSRALRF